MNKSEMPGVIRLDIENQQQRSDLQKLFTEYSSVANASIKENIVDKFCELPYFTGFIAYLNDEKIARNFLLDLNV